MKLRRRFVVGVMGSGLEEHRELADPLGRWLASSGHDLLTGGGGGNMAAVGRAFLSAPDRRGISIGVLPGEAVAGAYVEPGAAYPNPWVELVVRTHLPRGGERGTEPLSRNHVNVLTASVIVALPGGAGTSSEVHLAQAYGRPVIAFLGADGTIPDLPEDVPVARDLEAVVRFVTASAEGSAADPADE